MRESELIIRAKLGDKDALGQIISQYYNDIYRFLFRRTGKKEAAEDLTQEVFLRFTLTVSSYKDKNRLKSYLFTIAINISNDYFRKLKNETYIDETIVDSCNISENVEKSEKYDVVKNAIESLKPFQRDVVLLRYYHEMKISEISKILGIPQTTVRTRLFRANKILEEILKGEIL